MSETQYSAYPDPKDIFPDRLDAALDARGIQERERSKWLADRFGVTVPAAFKWLHGQSLPDSKLWAWIAVSLDQNVEELFFGAKMKTRVKEVRLDSLSVVARKLEPFIERSAFVPNSTPGFSELAVGDVAIIDTSRRKLFQGGLFAFDEIGARHPFVRRVKMNPNGRITLSVDERPEFTERGQVGQKDLIEMQGDKGEKLTTYHTAGVVVAVLKFTNQKGDEV
jgi:hypothetical protein